jgi:DNA-binding transcriptional ArsR family regulator
MNLHPTRQRKTTMPAPADLERVFHEPNRLAILSALCAADDGVAFTVLRDACRLTDGNLNRHLKALEDEQIVKIRKTFVLRKPRTTIAITPRGLARFQTYLDSLGTALKQARQSLPAPGKQNPASTPRKTVAT